MKIRALIFLPLCVLSFLASANENQYYFILPLNGVVSSDSSGSEISYTEEERLAAWDDFATTHGLSYGGGWSSIYWSNKSLTSIPVEPYPNATPSTIQLRGNSLPDVSGLSGITSVSSHFLLDYADLSDLTPLSNLLSVGGYFYLNGNDLTNLNGLENFTGGSTRFYIHNNPMLEDLTAIQNINSLGEMVVDSRKYSTRMPENSPLCEGITNNQISLLDTDDKTFPKATVCEVSSEWEEFAADNLNLGYNKNWSSIYWANKSLTTLPTEPFPNTSPATVRMESNSISDISGLSGITSLSGYFLLHNNEISDLSPLSSLTSVGGYFYLMGNQLTNLNGLENYTGGGARFYIYNNPLLEDLTAIQNINSLDEMMVDSRKYSTRMPESSSLCEAITNNQTSLVDTDGSTLPKGVVCEVSSEWEEFAADNLNLGYNKNWSSIYWANNSLTTLPTEPFPNTSPGTVRMESNSISDISGLSGISSLSSHFLLHNNEISDLSPLSSLTSVGGYFYLMGNQLTNLNGLENYTGGGSRFYIYSNPLLEDLTAIQNINSLGELRIDNREYATRMPMASPLCQAISGGQTSLADSSGSAMPISHVCI